MFQCVEVIEIIIHLKKIINFAINQQITCSPCSNLNFFPFFFCFWIGNEVAIENKDRASLAIETINFENAQGTRW